MKRTYIFSIALFFALTAWNASAQPSGHYYHVGDTINGRSPIYYYQWWSENWLTDTSHRLRLGSPYIYEPVTNETMPAEGLLHGEELQYYYTETPLQIIGIATSCVTASIYHGDWWDRDMLFPEYLRLYDASVDTFCLIKEVQYDRNTPKRYMNVDIRDNLYFSTTAEYRSICCYYECNKTMKMIPIREYYFDKPVTVTDSFYLGHTTNNQYFNGYINPNLDTFDNSMTTIFPFSLHCINTEWYTANPNCTHTCENSPNHLKKYRNIYWDAMINSPTHGDTIDSLSVWRWTSNPSYMVQFPIIVIDSSYIIPPYECPPVTNLRIANQGEGRAVLFWDTHADHNSWQVCYGPQGTPPESCTITNCPIQVGNIMGLDSCTHYDAYVRGVCFHDSTCYSDWVGPIDIFFCDTASGGGADTLGTVTALNVLTNIVPNPASTQATVYSSFQISRIVVFNSNGQRVFDSPASGMAATLDLKGWTPGLYIVLVHTPAGTVAKKLVKN